MRLCAWASRVQGPNLAKIASALLGVCVWLDCELLLLLLSQSAAPVEADPGTDDRGTNDRWGRDVRSWAPYMLRDIQTPGKARNDGISPHRLIVYTCETERPELHKRSCFAMCET